MRWSYPIRIFSTFFLFLCFRIIGILISIENKLTKKIDLPTLENRLRTSDLCCGGAIPHLSPEIPTHQFYVLHKKLSKMNKPPPPIRLNVLIACEESQTSCMAFRQLGHNAYSCDLQPCSGGHPEWHIQGDALDLLELHWDLVIAHPPCTYLCQGSATRMFPSGVLNPLRLQQAEKAKAFFMAFYNAACPHIAIENPRPLKIVGLPWSTQVIEPWQFGEPWSKETHLWLKDLPLLRPTQIVTHHRCFTSAKWDAKSRSKTFAGIAAAWADQWSRFILESDYP